MSITNEAQLQQTLEQIGRLYGIIASLRAEFEAASPENFAVFAEGPLDALRELQAEVDEYVGVAAAQEHEVSLWLRIVGKGIEHRDSPTSVITAMLDTLRKGVQTVAELIATGELSTRPTADLKRACDLRVVALAGGSLRIGVRLPEPAQLALSFTEDPHAAAAQQALREYLEVATWAGSGQDEIALAERVPDARRRRVLLTELSRLVPRERGDVDCVELSGSSLPQSRPVQLHRETRRRIHLAIDRTVVEQVETHVGDLREIDLDERSFTLRRAGEIAEIRCRFEEPLLETAKEALDRRVEVTGTRRLDQPSRRSSPLLLVARLEILEDDTE
jgi:hypothetical protein